MKLFLIPTTLASETAQTVLSPQIKEVIAHTDYYLVENVRTARRFISELKTGKVIDELTFEILDKDSKPEDIQKTFKNWQKSGKDIGIMSEAGCPGVADPGAVAVKIAHQLGIQVVPLVGPSSILLGLMASGFSGQSFAFHGYLSIDKNSRAKQILQLEKEASQKQQTQIFMETPFRNNQFLEDLLTICAGSTFLCIAANVTAADEFIQTKTIAEWRKVKPDLHKKPTMFLLSVS